MVIGFMGSEAWARDQDENSSERRADYKVRVINTAVNCAKMDMHVPAESTLVFYDDVRGSGDFTGAGTVIIEGGLYPGNSPGVVNFGGDVIFGSQSTLEIEIGGTDPGNEHDVINVAGELTCGGTLEVVLIWSFDPNEGDEFDILNFGSISSTFNPVNLPALAAPLVWDSSTLYIDGILRVMHEPELRVDDPNGGEALNAGSIYEVKWSWKGLIDTVVLEYSINSGADWNPIDTVVNTGSYMWEAPGHNSERCLLRIQDSSDPLVNDISDGDFTIYICTLVTDLTGDCYIDVGDLAVFCSLWLAVGTPPNCPSADFIGGDCTVNFADYAVLANEWRQSGNPFQ